jgi:hypothetical protein
MTSLRGLVRRLLLPSHRHLLGTTIFLLPLFFAPAYSQACNLVDPSSYSAGAGALQANPCSGDATSVGVFALSLNTNGMANTVRQ